MSQTISVRLKKSVDRSYAVVVQSGILSSLAEILAKRWGRRGMFIISDSTVGQLYARTLQKALLGEGIDAPLLLFAAGEKSKNAATVYALQTQLLEQGVQRESLVIALGGGVVGDVAGYVAATILRGIQYVQVPTTLLAQVDSSVGGKVGVDHPRGKNLIGAFHQPSAVYIDTEVLKTLPVREFRAGLAEIVKIAAALDADFFRFIERNRKNIRKDHPIVLTELIRRAVGLKGAVVMHDEREANFRKVLNLGHTVGHAVEAATSYSILHGEAVAIGIVAEAQLAVRVGFLSQKEYRRLVGLLKALKLPIAFPKVNKQKFFDALAADKKSVNGRTQFVLLKSLGSSVIGVEIPHSHLIQVLGWL